MIRMSFVASTLLAFAATAQPAQPEHVRGEITKAEGNTLTVKSHGKTVELNLPEDAKVATAEKGSMSDVKDGAFIGTTAVPGKGGTLRAIEVHVFPDSMRGTGEGHRPWDLRPGSTMTNATVSGMEPGGKSQSTMTNATVSKKSGGKLTLKYKDGEKTVMVPPNTKVVKLEPGDKSDLKPGAHVFVIASRQSDGTLRADRMTVGKNGVVPPM
jgi:hypothetical protein